MTARKMDIEMTSRFISAFISGCATTSFTSDEKKFFNEFQPWGLILFGRNCQTPDQVKELTSEFRSLVGRKDAPVLIDQEGGRVQRLGPPKNYWIKYPAAASFGKLYSKCAVHALRAARNAARLMADDLAEVGINVNCLPVLDVPQANGHSIVGDRAYATCGEIVLALARTHVAGMLDGGVLPVMKHIPGHGRAMVDSHLELPVVSVDRAALESVDFRTFAGFADCPMAMTAHVVYEALDPKHPATLSRIVLRDVVRKQLGFLGLLMSDDLSMKALQGTYEQKTKGALEAGCDVVLHCNGNLEEMHEVAKAAGPLKGKSMARAKAALRHVRKPIAYDKRVALKDLEAVLKLQDNQAVA